MNILEKYSSIVVNTGDSILSVLKTMEREHHKLLIVSENKKYKSLISIGDTQRAIIANVI